MTDIYFIFWGVLNREHLHWAKYLVNNKKNIFIVFYISDSRAFNITDSISVTNNIIDGIMRIVLMYYQYKITTLVTNRKVKALVLADSDDDIDSVTLITRQFFGIG